MNMRNTPNRFFRSKIFRKGYFKILVILIAGFTYLQTISAQDTSPMNNCYCIEDSALSDFVGCDTTSFSNGSRLYRQFNCDSSWLVFEQNDGTKKTMSSLQKPMIEYTERLGYQFVKEYRRSLLFMNRQASGGGFPVDFELLSKDNAALIENFGHIIYYSDDSINNYVLYLSSGNLDTLTFYNIDAEAKYFFPVPAGRLSKTVSESSVMFPEYLFDEPKISENILTIVYKYLISDAPEKWGTGKITIDLRKTMK